MDVQAIFCRCINASDHWSINAEWMAMWAVTLSWMCDGCTGEDPLVDDQSDHDINSVAGVLKLYFRGLENPLFPKERFLDLISTTSKSHPRWLTVFKWGCFLSGVRFSLLFRARLWCRKSSSASPDNRDPSAARDRRHEILVCLPESVSLRIAFAVIWDAGKWITAASIFLVFLSTATRTWWIPTT